MLPMELGIFGAGLSTDAIEHVSNLVDAGTPRTWTEACAVAGLIDSAALGGHDVLSQLALRAIHQAWHMADLSPIPGTRVGMIVQTSWGAIDSTAAYLESMLEADGRYASPRHFSRSVYSSVASIAAIHFGIKGPCETLVFDQWPILGALRQAWRMLATKCAERVVIVWCEQAGELASDLAKKAAKRLHRREFDRYQNNDLGFGAIALVVGPPGGLATLHLNSFDEADLSSHEKPGMPFAMDNAVSLLQLLLRGEGFSFAARRVKSIDNAGMIPRISSG